MNLALQLAEIEKQASALISENLDLKKENTELKEKYDTCLRENTGLKIHSAYLEKKLAEAEQFLKEVEK